MRTKNSFLNFLANTGSHLLNVILSFIARTVFIYVLSQEYLGVNGLFGNILTVLNLAELGVGGAIIYHIYKPIAEGDEQGQTELMNMYKLLYRIIACVIAVAGLALVPFLDYLIKDKPDIPGLTFIYLLYLFNTVSSYFFSYKRAIIDAHQKQYVGTIINTIFTTIQFLVQIVVLLVLRNFIAYLLVQIICNVLTNIVVAWQADRMYPFLKKDTKTLPDKEKRKGIYKNVGAMFIHKVGSVVVNDTDNLIMSAFVGITSVGIYSNYQMIQYSINVALNGVFGAFTASIGNLGAIKDREKLFEVYNTLQFLGFWLYGFCTVAFVVMYNPFIEVWAGSNYLFPMSIVLIICICFYVSGGRVVTLTFRDAMGLYWYDRYKPFFEIAINLSASLYLVQKIGIVGIFAGTLLSTFTTSWWVEPYVTYKHGFKQPVWQFFRDYFKYAFSVVAVGGFTYWVCNHFTMGGIPEILCKGVVCVLLYNGIILLLYVRTENFKNLWTRIMGLIEARRQAKNNG
jgi:O-antigen/teichoic acid export membrane protein